MMFFRSRFLQIVQTVEALPVGWRSIFIFAGLIIFVRVLAEGLLNPAVHFSYWTVLFWTSWFFSLFIAFTFLVGWIGKMNFLPSAKLLLAGLPIIWIPIIGSLAGFNRVFDFPQGSWEDIFFHIKTFAFFYPNLGPFFTLEICLFLLALFAFFFSRTHFIRALFGTTLAYGILVLFALQGKLIGWLFESKFLTTNFSSTQMYAVINVILFVALAFLFFLALHPSKAIALLFRLRPERTLSLLTFLLFFLLGSFFAPETYIVNSIVGFILFTALLFSAALTNDIKDLSIDKISNPQRLLPSRAWTVSEVRALHRVVLVFAAVCILLLDSFPVLVLALGTLALSFLYSTLYVRQQLFSYLLVALGESSVVLFGYFSQQPLAATLSQEMFGLYFAVFALFGFFLPIKDLKDFAGDRKEGVRNFLTVFGWDRGIWITSVSVCLGYILFGAMVGHPLFFWASTLSALLGFFFVIYYKQIGEKASYINFFFFVLTFFILMIWS